MRKEHIQKYLKLLDFRLDEISLKIAQQQQEIKTLQAKIHELTACNFSEIFDQIACTKTIYHQQKQLLMAQDNLKKLQDTIKPIALRRESISLLQNKI